MGLVSGAPDLLDAYTARTVPTLDHVRDALADYRDAVAACNAAPDDLGATVTDLSGEAQDTVEQLDVLDRVPAALAAALRQVDRSYDADAQAPGQTLHAEDGHPINRLILAHLVEPGATDAEADELAASFRHYNGTVDSLAERLPLGLARQAHRVFERLNRDDGWRGSLAQFGRVGGNTWLALSESDRLADLRARYPSTSRVIVQAANAADDAADVLRANDPFLPSLGARLPPQLTGAARLGTKAITGLGVAGLVASAIDFDQDLKNQDVGGAISNAAALTGGGILLLALGGPVTMTLGAVLVVGSLIYEANSAEIDAAVVSALHRSSTDPGDD